MTTTTSDIPKILDSVRGLLSKGERRGVPLKIEEDYQLEDDWLYLCVTPTKKGVRALDYAEVLGEIEDDLRKEGYDRVLLVPTLSE